jgi:CBS domain-containing protein
MLVSGEDAVMKMREIMRRPSSVGSDDTVWRAERVMARRRLKHVPVLDEGRLVGVISERDVLALRAADTERDWWLAPVHQAMRDVALTVDPDEPASTAAERLAATDGFLPVVEHGVLVGIVTATDVLEAELRARASTPAGLTAAELMTESLVTVSPGDALVEAARLMADHQIRHLPVVENGAVVGMLSERDLLPVADELGGDLAAADGAQLLKVGDAMTSSVTTISADASLADVSRTLLDHRIGAVPVVDRSRRPLGIVSYVDVLRALAAQLA